MPLERPQRQVGNRPSPASRLRNSCGRSSSKRTLTRGSVSVPCAGEETFRRLGGHARCEPRRSPWPTPRQGTRDAMNERASAWDGVLPGQERAAHFFGTILSRVRRSQPLSQNVERGNAASMTSQRRLRPPPASSFEPVGACQRTGADWLGEEPLALQRASSTVTLLAPPSSISSPETTT